ncbi:MAG: dTDP-4-dehydrorhamnose 3,5-epimerase [Desulfovibrionales bacterium]|nr:dTDP-4-dehydrorhamnose 3,5-epimerase [Desulfovibrionales bacterium]
MRILPQRIADVLLLEPRIFTDERGFFLESYHEARFAELVGSPIHFVQDNHSRSSRHVLRGLHYQIREPQGKLVRVIAGEIFDVAVDLRRSSPTFGQWTGVYLSADNKLQLWIPEGFAHGFLALADQTEVLYKTTRYYAPEHERCIIWNDPRLAIAWPLTAEPGISVKDAQGVMLEQAEIFD